MRLERFDGYELIGVGVSPRIENEPAPAPAAAPPPAAEEPPAPPAPEAPPVNLNESPEAVYGRALIGRQTAEVTPAAEAPPAAGLEPAPAPSAPATTPKPDQELKNDEINRNLSDALNYKAREIETLKNWLEDPNLSAEQRAEYQQRLNGSNREVELMKASGNGQAAAETAMRIADQIFANERGNLDIRMKEVEDNPAEKAALEAEKKYLTNNSDSLIGNISKEELEARQKQREEAETTKQIDESLKKKEDEKAAVQRLFNEETDPAKKKEYEEWLGRLDNEMNILKTANGESPSDWNRAAAKNILTATANNELTNLKIRLAGAESEAEKASIQYEMDLKQQESDALLKKADPEAYQKEMEKREAQTTDKAIDDAINSTKKQIEDVKKRLESDPANKENQDLLNRLNTQLATLNAGSVVLTPQMQEQKAEIEKLQAQIDALGGSDPAQTVELIRQRDALQSSLNSQVNERRENGNNTFETRPGFDNDLDDSEFGPRGGRGGGANVNTGWDASRKAAVAAAMNVKNNEIENIKTQLKNESLAPEDRARLQMELAQKEQESDSLLKQVDLRTYDQKQEARLAEVNQNTMTQLIENTNTELEQLKAQLKEASPEEQAKLQARINELQGKLATINAGLNPAQARQDQIDKLKAQIAAESDPDQKAKLEQQLAQLEVTPATAANPSEADRIRALQMLQQMMQEQLAADSRKLWSTDESEARLQIFNDIFMTESKSKNAQQEQVTIDPLQDDEVKKAAEALAEKIAKAAKDNQAKDSQTMEAIMNEAIQMAASNPKLAAALSGMLQGMNLGNKVNKELDKISGALNEFAAIDKYSDKRSQLVDKAAKDFQTEMNNAAIKPRSFWAKLGTAAAIAGAAALTIATGGATGVVLYLTIAGAAASAANQFIENKWLGYAGMALSMGAGVASIASAAGSAGGAAASAAGNTAATGATAAATTVATGMSTAKMVFEIAKTVVPTLGQITGNDFLQKLGMGLAIAGGVSDISSLAKSGSSMGDLTKALKITSVGTSTAGAVTGNRVLTSIGAITNVASMVSDSNFSVRDASGNQVGSKWGQVVAKSLPIVGGLTGNETLSNISGILGSAIGFIDAKTSTPVSSSISGDDKQKYLGGITEENVDSIISDIDARTDLSDDQKEWLKLSVAQGYNASVERAMANNLKEGLEQGTVGPKEFFDAANFIYGYDPNDPDTLKNLPKELQDVVPAMNTEKQAMSDRLVEGSKAGNITAEQFVYNAQYLYNYDPADPSTVKNLPPELQEYAQDVEEYQALQKQFNNDEISYEEFQAGLSDNAKLFQSAALKQGPFAIDTSGIKLDPDAIFKGLQAEFNFQNKLQELNTTAKVNEAVFGGELTQGSLEERLKILEATDQIPSDQKEALKEALLYRYQSGQTEAAGTTENISDSVLGMRIDMKAAGEAIQNAVNSEISRISQLPEDLQQAAIEKSQVLQQNMSEQQLSQLGNTVQTNTRLQAILSAPINSTTLDKIRDLDMDPATKSELIDKVNSARIDTVETRISNARSFLDQVYAAQENTAQNGSLGTWVSDNAAAYYWGGGSQRAVSARGEFQQAFSNIQGMLDRGQVDAAEAAMNSLVGKMQGYTETAVSSMTWTQRTGDYVIGAGGSLLEGVAKATDSVSFGLLGSGTGLNRNTSAFGNTLGLETVGNIGASALFMLAPGAILKNGASTAATLRGLASGSRGTNALFAGLFGAGSEVDRQIDSGRSYGDVRYLTAGAAGLGNMVTAFVPGALGKGLFSGAATGAGINGLQGYAFGSLEELNDFGWDKADLNPLTNQKLGNQVLFSAALGGVLGGASAARNQSNNFNARMNPLGLFDRPALVAPDTASFLTPGAALEKNWFNAPPGVQIAKNGDWWAKRVNPDASTFQRWYGQQTINAQYNGLQQLDDLGTPSFMQDGVLFTRDAGPTMKTSNALTSDFWEAWVQGSWRMKTVFNDIRPRNVGANGVIFDPAWDPLTKGMFQTGAIALPALGLYSAMQASGMSTADILRLLFPGSKSKQQPATKP